MWNIKVKEVMSMSYIVIGRKIYKVYRGRLIFVGYT